MFASLLLLATLAANDFALVSLPDFALVSCAVPSDFTPAVAKRRQIVCENGKCQSVNEAASVVPPSAATVRREIIQRPMLNAAPS